MCSSFREGIMDGDIHGDLAGIVRASGGPHPSDQAVHEFSRSSIIVHDELPPNEFGDSFMATRDDPLLHEVLELPDPVLFDSHHDNSTTEPLILGRKSITDNMGGGEGGRTTFIAQNNLGFSDHDQRMEQRSPPNIFSRILHIHPTTKISLPSPTSANSIPKEMKPSSSSVMNDTSMTHEINSFSGVCVVDNGGMQIPPALKYCTGIKRRKNQAKKVVCVPAPAASSNRPTGEVVPTDLWAWRKYGQKPIKGSPHPRSYYKCSSSKGCSARKQVERSRADPNMLVITYTSEHSHPWPTHRNALAGRSTLRSQQLKANVAYTSSKGSPSPSDSDTNAFNIEEHKVSPTTSTINPTCESTMKGGAMLQEEEGVLQDAMIDEEIGQDQFQLVNEYSQPGDFFADLGELESTDPINLMFCQGLPREKPSIGEEKEINKTAADHFTHFDWPGTSFGDG